MTERRAAAAGLPRLPVADRLRDRRPGAVRANPPRASSTRGSGTRSREQLRAEHVVDCSIVYWTDRRDVERAGALERRPVRVRRPELQRRHRHLLQLADEQQSVPGSTQFVGPGPHAQPARRAANTPVFDRNNDPASGSNLPFPPANTVDPRRRPTARWAAPGCLYTGPTTITLKSTGKMDVTSPHDAVDERGLRAGQQPEPASQRRDLRAERADRALRPEPLVVLRRRVQR